MTIYCPYSTQFYVSQCIIATSDRITKGQNTKDTILKISNLHKDLTQQSINSAAEIALFKSEKQNLSQVMSYFVAHLILDSSSFIEDISALKDEVETRLNFALKEAVENNTLSKNLETSASTSVQAKLKLLQIIPESKALLSQLLLSPYDKEFNEWILETVTFICKDLADNFSPNANKETKESIFTGTLEPVTKISLTSFKQQLLGHGSTLDQEHSLSTDNAESCLKKSFNHILDFHFGHADSESILLEFKEVLVEAIHKHHPASPSRSSVSNTGFYKLFYSQVDNLVLDAWKEATTNATQRIKNMPRDEREAWQAKHGSKPMDLTEFLSILDNSLQTLTLVKLKDIDFPEVTSLVKDKVASAWGLSDFLFEEDQDEKHI